MKKIAVIIPAYNAASFLAEALDSVAAQEMPDLEIVVIDDGSTDDTAQIAAQHFLQPRVLRQPRGGPALARNAGLDHTTAEWIAFLDADDLWPRASLAPRARVLAEQPGASFVIGLVQFEKHDLRPAPPLPWKAPNLGSGLYRREVFTQVGLFDPSLLFLEDIDWFWRAKDAGLSPAELDEITLIYRRHAAGVTAGKSWVEMGLPGLIRRAALRRKQSDLSVVDLTTSSKNPS